MANTDVSFGRGFSIQELVDTPIHVLASLLPDKEFTPFQWYAVHPDMQFPVKVKIQVRGCHAADADRAYARMA